MYAIHSSGQIPPGEVSNELHRQQPKSSTLSKPHPCDRCSKSFSSVHQLSQHTRVRIRFILLFKSSESPTILLQVHTGEKPYKCNYCERRFKQQSHVKQHSRLHTGERPYKCTECGRTFVQVFC